MLDSNPIEHISIQDLQHIEDLRRRTMSDPNFQKWCKDMHIGIRAPKREPIEQANRMMSQWSGRAGTDEWQWPEWVLRL